MAAVTERVGLIATASTTYTEPYDLARRMATLDHISQGRAGWNIVTSTMENEAHNYGREAHMGHSDRYARAAEFVDVARRLWDSWEDGAVLADKAERALHRSRADPRPRSRGEHFSVAGPLTVPRSPQGHPVLVQAGASDTGKRFAASCAEVIFTSHPAIETARGLPQRDARAARRIRPRARRRCKIMPAITPIIGATRAAARAIAARSRCADSRRIAISKLQGYLGWLRSVRVCTRCAISRTARRDDAGPEFDPRPGG